MSFKIDFKEYNDSLLISIVDVFLPEDFDRIMGEITSSTEYPANVNAIFDLTQMLFDNITSDFLRSLQIRAEKYSDKRFGAKTAYVCPKDLQFGMIRMWAVYVDSLPVEIMITRSMDEALSWVKK